MSDTLHQYYGRQEILPTYGAFQSEADLAAHERQRRRLFTDKLQLPPRLFAGARLIEFGPDAGENALVFARWGASCTLAEPNSRAHPVIREYFGRFQLNDRLSTLVPADVQGFADPADASGQFDVVDAEGFIYTVQPSSMWMDKFSRLVSDEGFVILFYYETYGCFLELLWRVTQARFRRLTGLGAAESARQIFEAKWNSIPHKRRIESWTMDVLENPFVRLRYCLEPQSLCRGMSARGFRLYSSWPRYQDGLEVHWFKRELTAEAELAGLQEFIARSRLSHMFGRKHFLRRADASFERELTMLMEDVDALIDGFETERARRCQEHLAAVRAVLSSADVLSSAEDVALSLETVEAVQRLLGLLETGSVEAITSFCSSDRAFIRSWGMPSHFAVFRKETPAATARPPR